MPVTKRCPVACCKPMPVPAPSSSMVVPIAAKALAAMAMQPGVFRAHVLDSGEIHEVVLPIEAVHEASALSLINSVRRWCPIYLIDAQPSHEARRSTRR